MITRCVECNHEELSVSMTCACPCHTKAIEDPRDATIRTLRDEVKERDERIAILEKNAVAIGQNAERAHGRVATLRGHLVAVINATGGFAAHEVSDEFLANAPAEVEAKIATLQRDLDAARADGERLEKLFAENVAQYDEAQRRLEAAGVAIKTLLEMWNAAREKAGA